MGTIQSTIEGEEPLEVALIKNATVIWRSPKKGPYKGKEKEFYTFSLSVSDGSVPKDEEGYDSRFVNFSDHPSTDDIQPGDTVEFKLRYDSYIKDGETKMSLKGNYLQKVASTATPAYLVPSDITPAENKRTDEYKKRVDELESLIKEVIDPLFNKFWASYSEAEQRNFMDKNTALIAALNRYLPE